MVFPVVMYGCESWTVKKAARLRIDAFELWCWRRLLRVPWTARRSNPSILMDNSELTELTPKKVVLFIIVDWNVKVGSQEMPRVTGKFGLRVHSEVGQRLTESSQENTLVIANTLFQQHKRRFYILTSPDSQYRNQTDYILCSQRWRSSILIRNKTGS